MVLANDRFDKAVKTAIVASAKKLGLGPEPKSPTTATHTSPAKSTHVATKTAKATSAASHKGLETPVAQPEPAPVFKTGVFSPHQTIDYAAMADKARWEKTYSTKISTTGDESTVLDRVNSRFFRL